jgi:transcriptional regulator with XRE-family HTH domain
MKGSLNKQLEDPKYRQRFEYGYELFKLEVQILKALEDKGWTYADLAKEVGTSKQNIWRDLKNGGLRKASMDRVSKIAEALGLRLHAIFISQKNEKRLLPKLHRLLAAA